MEANKKSQSNKGINEIKKNIFVLCSSWANGKFPVTDESKWSHDLRVECPRWLMAFQNVENCIAQKIYYFQIKKINKTRLNGTHTCDNFNYSQHRIPKTMDIFHSEITIFFFLFHKDLRILNKICFRLLKMSRNCKKKSTGSRKPVLWSLKGTCCSYQQGGSEGQ